ncbi:MAG: SRPBCC family protein [Pedobacter sp.]|nr:SRPBCC family protein [Pedobacter sp.]
MTQLRQSLEIAATPAALFDYVTRPLRWKEWHHSSLEVRGVQDESLVAGRRFEESVVAAGGLKRELTWLVEESHPGKRWRASAYMADGSTVRLCYEFEATAAGTQFTRTLDYTVAPVLLRLINRFFLQGKVEKESEAALQRLGARFQTS